MVLQKLKPNGTLSLPLGWKGAFTTLSIVGGPYDAYPGRHKAFGVCVRAERVPEGGYDVHLPIHDFAIPSDDNDVREALTKTLAAALLGRQVYVGCMGGWGRTGLFLALLAKAAGVENPVEYVRENYTPKAVETKEQYAYVQAFDVSEFKSWLFWSAWKTRLTKLWSSF